MMRKKGIVEVVLGAKKEALLKVILSSGSFGKGGKCKSAMLI